MKIKTLASIFTGLAIASGIMAMIEQPSYAGNTTFFCETSNGIPTTFARTEDGIKLGVIRWVSNYGAWTPERRCQEVSRRFQVNYDRGTLRYITTGYIRGVPVICASNQPNASCTDNTLLLSLRPGTNPNGTLRRLLDRRALATGNAINESSQQIYVNFEKYLKDTTVRSNK